MEVAVICEFSGIVRDAFTKLGHNAVSYDLLPTERPGRHVEMDVRMMPEHLWSDFDLIICHPPCTYLAVSGARWWPERQKEQQKAIEFVKYLMNLPVKRIAIENPIGILSTVIRKPDQIIQPWQFGHGETKATCLWLKNLPKLQPTNIVEGREPRIHRMPPGPDRWKERSRTYTGIAQAMAEQWGRLDE
jgi:site-specific DNA-cytosine methylase